MIEHEQGIVARRRRSRVAIEQLVTEYESSGLSRTEFCRKQAVSLSTLNRYLKRRSWAPSEPAAVSLLAVELRGPDSATGQGEASGLAVALAGGRRIEVGRGFDGRTLVELLELLERL